MKRFVLATAGFAAVISIWAGLTLPARRLALTPTADGTVPGDLHIHTVRSDGHGTPDEIAAAAARAGLKFIVFTDHGDGTRVPDTPVYRSGVLCLDGAEISTIGGHLIALDMPAAPYPLAGEPRDVAEDVRRLGGFSVAAHPDSPKLALGWLDWNAPFDGVEWINPDTGWRVRAAAGWRGRLQLATALFHYPMRPSETLASLLTDFDDTMHRWSALASERKIVVLSGVDAHAKLGPRSLDPGDNRFSIPLPGYQASFSTFSVHVATDRPLSGNAAGDAALVVQAIRSGHLYTAVDALATPPAFEFTATNARGTVHQGDELGIGGRVSLHVRSNAPRGFTTSVWQGTTVLASSTSSDITIEGADGPAVYRVEIRTSDSDRMHPHVWLLSNPIYVRAPKAPSLPLGPARTTSASSATIVGEGAIGVWRIEVDRHSRGSMEEIAGAGSSAELRLRYALSDDPMGDTAVAVVWAPSHDIPSALASYDRLTFTGRASRPMRISLQLRGLKDDGQPVRWRRSVYLDTVEQTHTIAFAELTEQAPTNGANTPRRRVNDVMFVIDTVNTRPGSSGWISISDAVLEK